MRLIAVFLCSLLLAQASGADSYDRDAAQVLAGPCASCHGPDGRSPGVMPDIAGLPREYLLERLTAFQDGSEPATIMTRLMQGYDRTQIDTLAIWFSEVEE
ncbi:c-type cytochrome [Paracoccus caeni]|uniref:C-type cytochrome n=1 Tax=Paracoccus caeni TaxID=657651 RepID=A0A934SKN7_9RHOB|nr:c-type cytochrome [Paracoccus caeni]MBK4216859.1 c-type cytochrome [Paracoccus caeni]